MRCETNIFIIISQLGASVLLRGTQPKIWIGLNIRAVQPAIRTSNEVNYKLKNLMNFKRYETSFIYDNE